MAGQLRISGLLMVLSAIVLLTATQLIFKNRLSVYGAIPLSPVSLFRYGLDVVRDLPLLGGLVTLVIAATLWYAGISRIPLSLAFPIGALSYPLVYLGSAYFLGETISLAGMAGNAMILAGVLVITLSQ